MNQYFPPDNSATARIALDFVEACRSSGIDITVVCGYPSYDASHRPRWRPIRVHKEDRARVVVVGSAGFDRRRPMGRLLNYVTFLGLAGLTLPIVTGRADVVLMTDPPMAPLFALWVRRVGRVRSVRVWVQDLHPDFALAAGLVKNRLPVRVWRAALVRALRGCDEVIALGRDMSDRICSLSSLIRTRVVHNGWSDVVAVIDDHRPPTGKLRILHIGNVGFAGPWQSILRAAEALSDIAEFVFVGGGANEAVLRAAASSGTIRLIGRVPHAEVPRVAAEADMLLVGVRSGLEGFVVPSKGYEMMALGRCLLVVGDPQSEMRLLAAELGVGYGADDDVASIIDAVRLAAKDPARLRAYGRQGLSVSRSFARSESFRRFAESIVNAP